MSSKFLNCPKCNSAHKTNDIFLTSISIVIVFFQKYKTINPVIIEFSNFRLVANGIGYE